MKDVEDEVFTSLIVDGIKVGNIRLSSFPETGRGLAATKDIRKHETLLTISTRRLLNLKVIGEDFDFDWRTPPLPAHAALSLYILFHRSLGNSPIKAYIASLPTEFPTIPLTWPENLCQNLPKSTQAYLAKQRVVFEKHFSRAATYLVSNSRVSQVLSSTLDRQEFLWAWLAVNSRCIYQELSSTSTRDDNYVCSPMVDMINHVPSSVPHCKLSYDIKGLSVISQSSYRSGAEVFISYGAHSNEALLCEYGFVIPTNSDNNIAIDSAVFKHLESWHEGLLMEIGYYEDYTIDSQGYPSFRTDVAIRTALLSQEDCVEDARGCRRLTHYVNGRTTGESEVPEIDRMLRQILSDELQTAQEAITVLTRGRGTSEDDQSTQTTNIILVRQTWQDRVDILTLALAKVNRR